MIEKLNQKIKKMDWLDIAMIKWSCIIFGILLVIIFPCLLEVNFYIYIILFILLIIRPLYRFHFKKY